MRFKGFKDGGKIPRTKPKLVEQVVQDTLPPTGIPPAVYQDSVAIVKEQIFVFDEVLFDVGSAQLNHRFTYRLDSLVNILKANENLKVKIIGYTDNKGGEAYNLKLSKDRAGAVANYLVKQRMAMQRITHKGLGSENPIADNRSAEGRKKNRRVEIILSE
jgi:outer membrane protein OmpA-like peptidoglycan-associated protein